MKKIITSDITGSVGFPIKKGTLDHLQESYTEAIGSVAKSVTNNSALVTVLHGCVQSGLTISAGAVFYGGEVYQVDAFTFAAGPGTLLGTITVSNGTADPHTFTDGVTHNVHNVRKMVMSLGTSGTGTADYADWVRPIKKSYLRIGAWDMDATAALTVPFTISAPLIVAMSCVILNDAQTISYSQLGDVTTDAKIYLGFYNNNFYVNRAAAGFFDSVDFNDTSVNRGFILVEYID